eukprot:TRINITY_DN1726_c4_g1_i1.p1 TRINITY_DN1726_c4_g1~~TRINITY_DN1726_c4_g1_i1.p1  ORF type:complete len:471 (+),score=127.88 TRINITY_DN1726_c4_g1_i1:112-1524(+)
MAASSGTGCFYTPRTQAVLMGIVFLLTFTAYDTIQVYAKRLYPGDLGTNMTFAIYATFTFFEFFAPAVVNKIGAKASMAVGILGYASLVVAGLVFFETGHSSGIVLGSGCCLGLGASLLWTGQGRLILEYGTQADRGTVFGIFWALYRLASVTGGLLSYTYFSVDGSGSGSEDSGSTGLYIIFLALVLGGALATLFLADPQKVKGTTVEEEEHLNAGVAVRCQSDDEGSEHLKAASEHRSMLSDAHAPDTGSWWQEGVRTLMMFGTTPMLLLAPMFWTSGGNEPYILSGFTDRWFEKRTTGMEMAWYFSFSVAGSLAAGKALDKYVAQGYEVKGALLLLTVFTVVHAGGFACAAVVEMNSYWKHRYELRDPEVVLPTIAFSLWGLSDAMINTFLYWLVGRLYPHATEKSRAIGFFKMLNSAAHVVGYGILPTHRVSAKVQLIYNIAAYAFGVPLAYHVVRKYVDEGRSRD